MLRTLAIRDLAIIDRLEVEFENGLNALTGETGAGKSIIIGALGLALGDRTTPDIVRAGASAASVSALFDVRTWPRIIESLAASGYTAPHGELLITREVQNNGKSSARVGDRPAPLSHLRDIAESLVDMHSQHDHQTLLSVKRHIDLLDTWGGEELLDLRGRTKEAWKEALDTRNRLQRLVGTEQERLRQLDLLRFQIQDIASADLRDGEEEDLNAEAIRLRNITKLRDSVTGALSYLQDRQDSALDSLHFASRSLEHAANLDPALAASLDLLQSARYDAEEATRALADYVHTLDADPMRLESIQQRLGRISDLKRKYGPTVSDVLLYAARAQDELDGLEGSDEDQVTLEQRYTTLREIHESLCAELSFGRITAAERLEQRIGVELKDVALEHAVFRVAFESTDPGPNGSDSVEFLIAPNRGEPPRPLARIASGGEISRVMLAIKSAVAAAGSVPTLVFDEADAGIGGRTAEAIGQKMRRLSAGAHVLCITHLPQIAVAAHHQYAIEKNEANGRSVVRIRRIEDEERVDELARMIAGSVVTDAVRKHVRELLASGGA